MAISHRRQLVDGWAARRSQKTAVRGISKWPKAESAQWLGLLNADCAGPAADTCVQDTSW